MNAGRLALLLWVGSLFCSALAFAQEEKKDTVPAPGKWQPAGEVMPPAPTAGAEEGAGDAGPMYEYGGFNLGVHARIQTLLGMVGDDAHVSNGDVLSRDGFRLRRARLGVAGQLVRNWDYELELDLIDEDSGGNALLDAAVTWRACDHAWLQIGAGKLPFSRSLMVSSAHMQFIERAPWVSLEAATGARMLDPGRQVGLTMGGQAYLLRYAVGVYNGSSGISTGDLNDGLMYVARLEAGMGEMGASEADLDGGDLRWTVGLNGYLNQAPAADIRAAGLDMGAKFRGLSFFAETVWAKSIPATRPESMASILDETERWGMSAQLGYILPFAFADLELACRFALMDDHVHLDNEGDLWELTAGLNAYLHEGGVKLMVNYVMKEQREGLNRADDALLAMLQLAF